MKNQRNFLEASVADAAIVLDGETGTISDCMQACPDIASWLTEIQGLPQKGEFPPLDEPYNQAGDGYQQWLEGLLPPKS